MREIRTLVTGCGVWVGTAHSAEVGRSAADHAQDTGCLLLNFGHMPRSGVGDLSAHLADHIARQGIPTWRFDFPGLGDSPGYTPALERQLFRLIQTGMYVDPCLELLTALSEQTGIGRWVLGGLCGGAVTAVLAADHSPERIAGLLLIDLDVSLLPVGEGETISGASSLIEANGDRFPASLSSSLPASSTKGPVLQRLFSRRTWVRFATGEGRLGGRFPGLRRAVGRWIENENERGAELPSDRNQAVVDSLCDLLDHGMSVLSIRARGKMRDIYAESVDHVNFKHAWPPHYQVLRLEGTNHVFTAGEGETHVLEAVSHWLATHVPHCASSDRAVGSPTLEQ